jgi:hypothetical protein
MMYHASVTFWESVYELRKSGRIPRQWCVADILPHLKSSFSLNTVRTVPANQSLSRDGKEKGNYILRGGQPKAFRLGNGCYELIDDPGE